MNEGLAVAFYRVAREWSKETWPDDIRRTRALTADAFRELSPSAFLSQYCWVVYASGFKVRTIASLFPRLREAYYEFDLPRVAAMNSIDRPMAVFRNSRKARSVVAGARRIQNEGFDDFKARVRAQGIDALEDLPGIGPITKKHLARNVGLASVAKDDIWLVRIAEAIEATSVHDLAGFLSRTFGDLPGVVDVVIWRFCAEKAWNNIDDPAVNSVRHKMGFNSSQ